MNTAQAGRPVRTFLDRVEDVVLGFVDGETERDTGLAMGAYRSGLRQSFDTDTPLIQPTYGLLKVTNRCNSRCPYCSHGQGRPVPYEPSTAELSRVIEQMIQIGVKSINISGGEPLLRSDLTELLAQIQRSGVVPILLTNGLLLEKRFAELMAVNLKYVLISIDSLTPEIYQRQRGVLLRDALAGVEAAVRMREAKNPDLVIGITAVITRYNLDQLAELLEWCADRRLQLEITPYHHFDLAAPDELSPQDELKMRQTLARLIEMRQMGYPLANSIDYLENIADYTFHKTLPEGFRCCAAYTGVFVDGNLNLRPCWSWSLPVAANLRTEDLTQAWYSEAFREGRHRVRQLECSKCWMLCTSEFSLRFSDANPHGH